MKKLTSFLSVLLMASACQNNNSIEKDLIKKADWLIGNWEYKTNLGTLSENWKKVNDSTFKAQSFYIKEKDTIHNETILLQQSGETLNYTTIIKGQNNEKPIHFQLKEGIENELMFENLKNDYPQKISYKKISYKKDNNNSLTTQISGLQFGKIHTEKYKMQKTD